MHLFSEMRSMLIAYNVLRFIRSIMLAYFFNNSELKDRLANKGSVTSMGHSSTKYIRFSILTCVKPNVKLVFYGYNFLLL